MKEKFFVKKGNKVFLFNGEFVGYSVGSVQKTRSFLKKEGLELPEFLKIVKYVGNEKKHLNIAIDYGIDSLDLLKKIDSCYFGSSCFDVEIVTKFGGFGGGLWH